MREYTYTAATPCHFSIQTKDYSLHPGGTYTLPADNGFIQSLVAQGLLQQSANNKTEE
jgi:hypothetical protein